jgi:hypothetical protein
MHLPLLTMTVINLTYGSLAFGLPHLPRFSACRNGSNDMTISMQHLLKQKLDSTLKSLSFRSLIRSQVCS